MIPSNFTKQTRATDRQPQERLRQLGLGNDGNEFKIITQVFLYKFLNDKFAYEVKQASTQASPRPKAGKQAIESPQRRRLRNAAACSWGQTPPG